MTRKKSFLLALFLLSLSLLFLLQVKHRVQNLKKDLAEITLQIGLANEEIHVLKAEWTYLNNPDRLRQLANQYLSMAEAKPIQINKISNIKMAATKQDQNYASSITPVLKPIPASLRETR